MMYFVTGLVTAIAVIYGVAWAAKRSGRTVMVPPLARLDLSPHVLWPFVIGLFALAASYSPIAHAATWGTVGLNLVWCCGALFSLQGLGVSAGVLERTGVGPGVRILALAALAVIDAFLAGIPLGFVGLVDFWVNFRRLPRDGVTRRHPIPWCRIVSKERTAVRARRSATSKGVNNEGHPVAGTERPRRRGRRDRGRSGLRCELPASAQGRHPGHQGQSEAA